jgi:hypothetical protein
MPVTVIRSERHSLLGSVRLTLSVSIPKLSKSTGNPACRL